MLGRASLRIFAHATCAISQTRYLLYLHAREPRYSCDFNHRVCLGILRNLRLRRVEVFDPVLLELLLGFVLLKDDRNHAELGVR
jgi:hypothetical protein